MGAGTPRPARAKASFSLSYSRLFPPKIALKGALEPKASRTACCNTHGGSRTLGAASPCSRHRRGVSSALRQIELAAQAFNYPRPLVPENRTWASGAGPKRHSPLGDTSVSVAPEYREKRLELLPNHFAAGARIILEDRV